MTPTGKLSKPSIVERSCPQCQGAITFPSDQKTVLCPKCRTNLRVFVEEGRLGLRVPDRRDDRADVVAVLDRLDFDFGLTLERTVRFEKLGFWVLAASLLPFGLMLFTISDLMKGQWTGFALTLVIFLVFLVSAYVCYFNPANNRKIMKIQDERYTLRRRLENL